MYVLANASSDIHTGTNEGDGAFWILRIVLPKLKEPANHSDKPATGVVSGPRFPFINVEYGCEGES